MKVTQEVNSLVNRHRMSKMIWWRIPNVKLLLTAKRKMEKMKKESQNGPRLFFWLITLSTLRQLLSVSLSFL
ncbi:unnamed protein product [Cylicostephanus goldi]|uniref:Uncharacterized protein n=1 Tax=Cylicostephanus goldi TaxID=71465 RepID=A0A3P7REF3_CYLGO|nr:unnamed protein product [Cylicostephanus goldi]